MAAVAGGTVDDARVGGEREQREHLVDHHGSVSGLHRVAPRRKREFSASFCCVVSISAS